MSSKIPVLAFTVGDPGGIGPDITFRCIRELLKTIKFIPIVFGSRELLDDSFIQNSCIGLHIQEYYDGIVFEPATLYFKHCYDLGDFVKSKADKKNGLASEAYIKEAVLCIEEGIAHALVTAPICKESLEMALLPYLDHTSLLCFLTKVSHVSMAFYTPTLKVILATIHVPLLLVPSLITDKLLHEKIGHAIEFLNLCGCDQPKIALAGLNPHAGENGLFGLEDKLIIAPVVQSYLGRKDVFVQGPFPADTVFYRAKNGEFDLVIAMYHDQGLIPIKVLSFGDSVNVTMGLPFIRTSPDHGTAFDKAYKQEASIESMISATNLALKLL
jgi:4-hydroxythreonine-4-phosphate dehydrogenase